MTKVSDQRKTPVKESQQRGSVLFPLQYNFCNTANPFYDLWLHWHTEFEIIRIESGSYNIFINDRQQTLNAGDICFIPGKVIHGDAPDKGKCKYESAVFDIELIRLHGFSPDAFITDMISGSIIPNFYIPSSIKEIARACEGFFDAIREQREGWDSISTGYLMIIFGLIKKHRLYSERQILPLKKRIRNEKLDIILSLIKQKYNTPITLEELSEAAGFSPKYFCRVFREMTGRAPIEYLNWFRINKACAMIRETNEKLQDIAQKCGFNDFSYFIKTFHKYKKMTPLKYRNYDPLKNPDMNIDSEEDDLTEDMAGTDLPETQNS